MEPTDEQVRAASLFATGGSLKINAFAGAGKTTTLQLLAQHAHRKGLYLAFNKSIAQEASRKFPETVQCRTTHSLAFRATPDSYKQVAGKMTGSLNANAIASLLKLKDKSLSANHGLTARSQGFWIAQTLRSFMQGSETKPSLHHVPSFGRVAAIPPDILNPLRDDILSLSNSIWERMITSNDPTPLGHDGYLKLWAISDPRLFESYILLDEAQDSNPVVLGVLTRQTSQVVYVGDRHQQIYEWRGAVNAMERIQTANSTVLTQSFRFGTAIADSATKVIRYLGDANAIRGTPTIESRIGCADPVAVLCRTNAGVIAEILRELEIDRTPYVLGGAEELIRLLRSVSSLKQGIPSDTPEFFGFANWREVVEFSQTDEGAQLKTFVDIVQEHGEGELIRALQRLPNDESSASLTIATAHKAKGREWDRVLVADDFFKPRKNEQGEPFLDPAEARLFYVALTRAKEEVQVPEELAQFFGIEQRAHPRPRRVRQRPRPREVVATTPVPQPRPQQKPLVTPPLLPREPRTIPVWVVIVGAIVLFLFYRAMNKH